MTGGTDGDAGAEIEEAISVDVFHDGAAGRFRNQRIGTRVRRGNVSMIAFDHLPAPSDPEAE